jgi:putative pyruvate formate lyase activating enzyme
VFCQNHDSSWQLQGERVTPERLAGMMLELQALGCHNINWVTPELSGHGGRGRACA